MSTEEVFYIPRDTKVFCIYDPYSYEDNMQKDLTVNNFKTFGFNNISVQRLVRLDQVNNSEEELGFPGLPVRKEQFSNEEIFQWYTFINICRKARILNGHFVLAFSGNILREDIPSSVLKRSFTAITNNCYVFSSTKASAIVKTVLSRTAPINESVKDHLLITNRNQ